MVKAGITKSVLMLAFIGITLIGLVQPIAGMTDQGKASGQVCACKEYSNNTTMDCEKDYCNNITMDCGENYNCCVMDCERGYCNNTTMDCEKGYDCCIYNCEQDYNSCVMDYEMDYGNNTNMDFEKDCCNKTMMHRMMEDHMMNESGCMMKMGKNISAAKADVDCAGYSTEEAIKIHEMHLTNHSTMTEESDMEMMEHMVQAYECLTGENLTEEMMMDCEEYQDNESIMEDNSNNTTMDCEKDSAKKTMMEGDSENETMMHCCMMHCMANCMKGEHSENETMMPCMMEEDSENETMMPCMMENHSANESCWFAGMNQDTSSAQLNQHCAVFWLKQAIELHEMHMKYPSTSTRESNMELMCQMLRAHACITGENTMTVDMMNETMGMVNETMDIMNETMETMNGEADNKSTKWVAETTAYLSSGQSKQDSSCGCK